jgi:hypothetical protein
MNRSVASVIAGDEVTGAPGGRLRSVNPAQLSEMVAEDYSGSLQKAQMDVVELTAGTSFRLAG